MIRLKLKELLFLLSIIIFSFLIFSQSAFAWKIPLEVSTTMDDGETVYNKLYVGVEPDAMDGFDNLWDTPAMLSHPDHSKSESLQAYLSSKNEKGVENRQLWKDIKGISKGEKVWEINIESVSAGKSVSLRWEVPDGLLHSGDRLVLRDKDKTGADGRPVETDVSEESGYSYISDGADTRTLTLTLSREAATKHKSGSGSGFGCGTITTNNNGNPNNNNAVFSMLLLFSPMFIARLLRLRYRKIF